MRSVNPLVIPRNHKGEDVLSYAIQGNVKPLTELLQILKNPYNKQKNISEFQTPSTSTKKYQTFCGT